MKQNKFTQTEFHSLGITIQDYILLKKFTLGSDQLIRAYRSVKSKIKLHSILDKDILTTHLKKEIIKVSILHKINLPYKNIKLEDLAFTKSGTNMKDSKSIINNIEKIKGKPFIINCYSPIGDSALKCSSLITEKLLAIGLQPNVTNGIELNALSVDFDSGNSTNLLDKDFLLIDSFNSIYVTEYRKNYVQNLFEQAKLKKIPIILSSNVELINPNFKILNIRLNDEKKSHEEILKEFLES